MDDTQSTSFEKLKELIEGIDFTMLTTFTKGRLHSRPMSTQELDENGDLWFFSADNTRKVTEIEADNRVNAAYADPSGNRYVSVYGTADIVKDKAKIEEMWSPILKAWFPEGLDDPTLCLLRIKIEEAEYWDAPSSKVVQIAGFLKALATGTEASYGDHATIKLS